MSVLDLIVEVGPTLLGIVAIPCFAGVGLMLVGTGVRATPRRASRRGRTARSRGAV